MFTSAVFGGEQSAPWQFLVMTRAVANKDARLYIKRVSTTVLVSAHGTEVHLREVRLVVMLWNHRSHKVSGEIDGSFNRSLRWFAIHSRTLLLTCRQLAACNGPLPS